MNGLNALDPVRLLDGAARRGQPGLYLLFVRDSNRAETALRHLCGLGWVVTRSRREATLDCRTIRVLVADRSLASRSRGCAINGYMVDEDVLLDDYTRLAVLRPMLLANAHGVTA